MDYGEYLERTPKGETIPSEEFDVYLRKAEAALSAYTFGRSKYDQREEVKCALAELCGLYYRRRGRDGVVSESNDGLSVRYETGGKEPERKIIKLWLGETGLLFPGGDRGGSR